MTSTTHPKLQPAARMAALPPYFFHGLNERIAKLRAAGVDIIRMDMGSPDLPPAPFIIEALKQSAEKPGHHGYMPFGGTTQFREAWAHFYGRRFGVELDPQGELVGLLGSKEGIFNLAMAFVNPGDLVLVPDPGYAPYSTGALMAGGQTVAMPLKADNDFLPDLKAISPDIYNRTKLMWLNYPNNPTGAVAPQEFFAEVVAVAQQYGFLVAHDAPYTEITFDGYTAPSILQVPNARAVAVEFNSMSKAYNMGGWRVGVAAGHPGAISALNTWKSNLDSGSFQPILDASAAALTGDQNWLTDRNAQYRERRDIVVAGLRAAGLQADTPKGAIYVWGQLPKGVNEESYASALLEREGISVTPGTVFGQSGAGYIRISLGTPTDRVREAMARVKRFGASI